MQKNLIRHWNYIQFNLKFQKFVLFNYIKLFLYSWASSEGKLFTSMMYGVFELFGGSKSLVISICSSPEDIMSMVESSDDIFSTSWSILRLSSTTRAKKKEHRLNKLQKIKYYSTKKNQPLATKFDMTPQGFLLYSGYSDLKALTISSLSKNLLFLADFRKLFKN